MKEAMKHAYEAVMFSKDECLKYAVKPLMKRCGKCDCPTTTEKPTTTPIVPKTCIQGDWCSPWTNIGCGTNGWCKPTETDGGFCHCEDPPTTEKPTTTTQPKKSKPVLGCLLRFCWNGLKGNPGNLQGENRIGWPFGCCVWPGMATLD